MRIKNVLLNDEHGVPFEQILKLIRDGKLQEVKIEWRGAADPNNAPIYYVSGVVDDDVFVKGLGLSEKK